MEFKKGDVVILKSGGHKMTIEEIDEESKSISVVWFNDKKEVQRLEFEPETLKLLEKNKDEPKKARKEDKFKNY